MTMITPITDLLIAIYGAEKTAKSSIALSAPKPLVDFDFDQSFDRAAARVYQKYPGLNVVRVWPGESITPQILETADIVVRQYNMPIKIPGRSNEGFQDVWEGQVLPEMLTVIDHPRIKSIMSDTGTIMWLLDHQAHLERVQKVAEQRNEERLNLIPIEYARPNTEARAILMGARNRHKNFLSVHHIGAKYGTGLVEVRKNGRTEQQIKHDIVIGQEPAGFSQTSTIVDVVLRSRVELRCLKDCRGAGTYFEDTFNGRMEHQSHGIDETLVPTATFELCGYTLEAQNKKLVHPDFDGILGLVNALRTPVSVGG